MSNLSKLHEDLAGVVLLDRGLDEVLTEITGIARRALPGPEAASITLIRGEKAFTAAYDGQMALDADELQYKRGYGPCVDAGLAGQVLRIDDMATEERWPDYSREAAAHGIGSSLSVPLPFQSVAIGALNTYAGLPHAFTEEDQVLAEEVATWVALAVGNAEATIRTSDELAHLRIAMRSRAVIEQAKGVLIERYKISDERAFAVLTRTSQQSNVKLREVADQLVRTGSLPGV
ncbi:MAG TPA: GAF and ANTAR domain-containing protein [Propionibacteriaceae bacterium]|jgi:GAF domain-containing protein|nr:GAF and ANTAR domain-containing protein [Propionibacteriaceae bacterium]